MIDILETMTDGFVAFNPEWQITFINQQAVKILGKPKAELVNKVIWEVYSEFGDSRFAQECQRAIETQTSISFQAYFEPSRKFLEMRAMPSAAGLAVYFQDVTSRQQLDNLAPSLQPVEDLLPEKQLSQSDIRDRNKQVEAALRQSEERFKFALKNSPIFLLTQDRDLKFTWCYNPRIEYSLTEIVGKTDADFMPPDIAAQLTQLKQQVMQTEVGIREEIQIDARGAVYTYDLTIEPLYDEQGTISGITCASVDISDRKRMEEALRESEENFRAIFDQAAVGIAQVDLEGWFIQVNPALAKLTGYSSAELLTMRFQQITHADDLEKDLNFMQQLLSQEIDSFALEKRYIHKDGSVVWVNLTSSLVFDELEIL